jgi:hypothetical protein
MTKYLPVLAIAAAGALHAQSGELWGGAGASILVNNSIGSPIPGGNSNAVKLDDGFSANFRFTWNSSGNLGNEFQYVYNRSYLSDSTGLLLPQPGAAGMAIHQIGYNLLYYFNPPSESEKIRPFLTGGVDVDVFSAPKMASFSGGSPRPAFNYGGGVKYRISSLWAWRFDLRGYTGGKPDWSGVLQHQSGLLQQFEASVGLGFYF